MRNYERQRKQGKAAQMFENLFKNKTGIKLKNTNTTKAQNIEINDKREKNNDKQ